MRLILTALAVATLAASAATAADYDRPLELPARARIDFTIERTRQTADMPQSVTVGFRYRQEISPTPMGYRVRQQLLGIDYPASFGPADRTTLDQGAAITKDMTYEADESLAPLSILGWPELVDRMAVVMRASVPEDAKAGVDPVIANLRTMTAEVAARTLLREQAMTAAPQNMELDLGKPLSEVEQVANPMGGPPIKSAYTIELTKIDRTAGRAEIASRQILDPESVRASLKVMLTEMAKRDPSAPQPNDAVLDALKIERTTECRSEMDLKTGLAVKTDCRLTVTGSDGKGARRTQSDRWIITQTLVAP